MTLPSERTRAVLVARDFLLRLSSAYTPNGIKGVRSEIRQEARSILRHFPVAYEVVTPELFDERAVQEWYDRYERSP
jgi:hypothetical protein